MGFTKNQSTENETTENPPAKEDVVEKIKRTKPYRKTGFIEKQATENEPAANPATEEVAKKIKKTKFCRKRFNSNADEEPKRKRHIYKRKTNIKDVETEKKKKAVIRNSPRLFSELVYYLSDVQKTWVIQSGFESLLAFDLEMIPSKLASKVVEAFDHTSVSIGIENGRIYITEEDVFNAIGLPNGGKTIEQKSTEVTDRRHREWLAQFPNKLITTTRVVEKVKEETRLTELFKINFLTVLSNVLIGTPTHSYVDPFFTKFEELDKCVSYNWAKFLIQYLVIGKESWNQNASEFFRGSQIFLTLFYVDRVMHKGITFVDRKFPTYRGWTEEILKERQAIEVLTGEFGKGKILLTLPEYFSQDSESQKSPPQYMNPATSGRNDGPQKRDVDDDNLYGQEPSAGRNESFDNDNMDINNPAGDDWYECQQDYQGNVYDDYCQNNQGTDNANDDGSWVQNRQANEEDAENGQWHAWPSHEKDDLSNGMKSSERCFTNNDDVENVIVEDEFCKEDEFCEEDIIEMPEKDCVEYLRDKASYIINSKIQFEKLLKKAMEKHPSNEHLVLVKEVFNKVFSAKNGDEGTKEASSNFNEKGKEEVTPDANNPVDDQAAIDEDIIAYLHSEEGIKEMATLSYREKRDLASVPSFSLGPEIEILSQLGYDSDKENEGIKENEAFLTPKLLLREKSTRLIKVGPYAKSPYINRVIDINGSYTTEDITMWRFMLLKERDKFEEIFAWKGIRCIRDHMWTFICNTKLYYSIIDTWSTILNDCENYKADESPMRLFFTIGGLNWSLDVSKKVGMTYPIFSNNMDDMLSKYPTRKLQDIDMVFFPIYAYEHFYLIVYNMKKPAFEIIDNMKREEEPKLYYGKIPSILHSHFVKYLQLKGFQVLAQMIRKLKPSYLSMPWQTKSNSADCGIFVMRHMETYKGDTKNWETELRNEGFGQYKQIIKLRSKYNNAIMSSNINERKDEIMAEAQKLFKKCVQQTLVMLANTKVGGSSSTKRKTVTFSTNLTQQFDEA
ncbi:hypothetical protein POM88_001581 [Heracleum sosnowskyi]|uniref:Ubiquitin-like protease family profile domain-containing protein n=1 Tax=Heracleum sosnowskyi TaxID=360622 RepID=A0AAD8JDY5_9APIA|nr:hypothetical protein POM88_001581 [Heracleum sosnowskyi]